MGAADKIEEAVDNILDAIREEFDDFPALEDHLLIVARLKVELNVVEEEIKEDIANGDDDDSDLTDDIDDDDVGDDEDDEPVEGEDEGVEDEEEKKPASTPTKPSEKKKGK